MITIRTLFAEINIDPNKEYIIYQESYAADICGRPLPTDSEAVKSGNYYEYGNIIIETERKKYTITAVPTPYQWVVDLLNYIDSQKNTDSIFVDMFQIVTLSDGSFKEFECGDILVETI